MIISIMIWWLENETVVKLLKFNMKRPPKGDDIYRRIIDVGLPGIDGYRGIEFLLPFLFAYCPLILLQPKDIVETFGLAACIMSL
jgi:hypothetical protein